jgi:hypothetical protein
MSDLEAQLPKFYAELHEKNAFLGTSWRRHLAPFKDFLALRPFGRDILDYGCGPLGGLQEYWSHKVIAYDPYIPEFAADPWKQDFDTVFSCDVLEHMTEFQLRHFLRRLCKHVSIQVVFLALTARAANKTFSNGLNVHLTVHAPEWWRGVFDTVLGSHYTMELATADMLTSECVFGFIRRDN